MKRIFRFLKALLKYIFKGRRVGFEEYVHRLEICDNCVNLNTKKGMCDICGCYLTKKAKMSTEKCPEEKW